jgi:hypothetical protein
MTCTPFTIGNIQGIACGGTKFATRRLMRCPTCEMNTEHVEYFMGVYYGFDHTCTLCGDRWGDGELFPRPFRKAWRTEATRKARRDLAHALPRDVYERRLRAEFRRYDEL